VEEITYEEMQRLVKNVKRSALHLKARDAYGTETELPYMAKWARGEPDGRA
jgi:hypothetical protein